MPTGLSTALLSTLQAKQFGLPQPCLDSLGLLWRRSAQLQESRSAGFCDLLLENSGVVPGLGITFPLLPSSLRVDVAPLLETRKCGEVKHNV